MRKLAIAVLVIIVILVIAAVALPRLVDVNSYRDRIQAELQQRLGRPVTLGQLHLSIFPLALRAESPVIGEDPKFATNRPFAQAQDLFVRVKLLPLLHRDVQVQALELAKPKIELIKDAQGAWNFSSLGHAPVPSSSQVTEGGPATAGAPQQPAKQNAAQGNFSLSDLKITDGQVALTDLQKRQPRSVYDHIDLRLIDFAPDQQFLLQAAAHLPGQGEQTIKLDGKAGPINSAAPANTPFQGSLDLRQVSLGGLQRFLNSAALAGMDAVITGKADVNSSAGKYISRGSLKLEQGRVRGHDIGYPITADYSLADDVNTGQLSIEKGNLKLGSTPVSISGSVNINATPANVDLRINASDVSMQEVARLAAAFGVAFNPGMNVAGRLSADVRAVGPASQPAMNGKVSARDLVISGKELAQPVQVKAIDLALTPVEIRSSDFTASTGGTNATARFALSKYATPAPDINLNLRTSNADLAGLLSIAKAYGVSAADGVTGSGAVSLDVQASGPIKNSGAMAFNGSGSLQNAQLKTPALTEPLKVRSAALRFTQNSAVMENLAASLGSTNASGSLTLRNFQNPVINFTLSADKVSVNELQKIFAAQPAQHAGSRPKFWEISPVQAAAPAQPSFLSKATGGGSLMVGGITYDALALNNVRSKVTLDRGIIRLDPLTALVAQGQQSGSIVVDTRVTPATYTINSKLSGVDANKLLSSVSSIKQTLYGLLAANARTSFTTAGGDIAKSLNGALNLNLTNGKLAGVDMFYELANIGKFLSSGKQISQRSFTNVVKMTGDFNVRNGVAQTNNLQAVIDGGTLSANGLINLADQSLDMHLVAVLTKAMTNSVGGTGIGGYMNTALANKNGELVMPVLVSGSLAKPRVLPDIETLARMKLNNLLPTSSNPGGPTSGILGGLLGAKTGNQNSGAQTGQPQSGGLQGILNGLGGKKPAAQQPAPSSQNPQPAAPAGQAQPQQPAGAQPTWSDILNGALNKKKQQPASSQPPPPQPPPQK